MKVEGHRKQVMLFLTAILLPVVVLVALTLQIVSQERELRQKRIADEHRRLVTEIGRDLAAHLDRVAREETASLVAEPDKLSRRDYVNREIVLIAKIDDDRLVLPWESGPRSAEELRLESDTEFGRLLRRAESAEFSAKDPSLATEGYRRAVAVAGSPVQEGYARLQRARSLLKARRKRESLEEYGKVLALAPEVVDEYGVPLSLYAVTPLLEAGSEYDGSLERIGRQIGSKTWLSPAGVYLMKDLLEEIITASPKAAGASIRGGAEEQLGKILAHLQTVEQALSLKEDFPRLGLEPLPGPNRTRDEPLWVTYGQKPWLVGRSPLLAEGGYLLLALDFQVLSSTFVAEADLLPDPHAGLTLMTGSSPDGTALGPPFQGVSVAIGPDTREALSKQGALQRLFYFLALAVVLSVTLFGAYLLWRDVRREVQMAEMRSQFVSSVSHELKTPLTAIRMFAETLRLGRSKDPAAQAEYLDTIVNESERLTRLLNNVLDFSKIEQGQRIYHPAPASLAEIVRAAARAMEYPLKQHGFELELRIDEDLPQVHVDRDAIEQAVLNLLSNAMKYSGGSRTIGLVVRREDDRAVIQVIDRGVGIEPKDQARIFEKFYRVPTRDNQSLPGTGLGLSLVAHIAKAHGGSVRVESAPGQGSTFSIVLPLGGEP
jgi:signal transduction histidine kinase